MNVLMLSADENGFQPLGLAGPAAYLREAHCTVKTIDLDKVDHFDGSECAESDWVTFSVPVFAAIEKTLKAMRKIRAAHMDKPIIIYNQYATIQPETFLIDENSYVIVGEFEEVLCDIVQAISEQAPINTVAHVWSLDKKKPTPCMNRNRFIAPDRSDLPALGSYDSKEGKIVGNVETMKGCAHSCLYCSVFAAYKRHVIPIPFEIVLEDIKQVVSLGAQHITFVDADFFSTGHRGAQIIKAFTERYPLTFDITARLDDVIRFEDALRDMKARGCVEITTAVEFPKQEVLDHFNKQMTVGHISKAIQICKEIGIRLNPTFITYTPWVDEEDIERLNTFMETFDLTCDPLQKETKLLLYKGSPLLKTKALRHVSLVEKEVHFDWIHPLKPVEALYHRQKTTDDRRRKRCCIKG